MGIKICPSCGGKVAKSRNDCPHCGHNFQTTKKCPECKEYVDINTGECPICGHFFVQRNTKEVNNTKNYSEGSIKDNLDTDANSFSNSSIYKEKDSFEDDIDIILDDEEDYNIDNTCSSIEDPDAIQDGSYKSECTKTNEIGTSVLNDEIIGENKQTTTEKNIQKILLH